MTLPQFDVLALGNAIVDVVAPVHEDFLLKEGLPRGSMTLIDEARADALLRRLSHVTEISGGSAANTAVGVASLGGRSAFIGKVNRDEGGAFFARNIREAGVHFESLPSENGPLTARCVVLVTPDGERTMATYLGACQHFTVFDVDRDLIERAQILYLEGYLWDPPQAIDAFRLAARHAQSAGRRVALSLSDPFCVGRHRDDFIALLNEGKIDLLFANQREISSLYETADLETAISLIGRTGVLAVVTQSERGCSVVQSGARFDVPAFPVEAVVDATGAGDLFAAGFLFGFCRMSHDLRACARLGSLAASEVISHFGARPEATLKQLAIREGLISQLSG